MAGSGDEALVEIRWRLIAAIPTESIGPPKFSELATAAVPDASPTVHVEPVDVAVPRGTSWVKATRTAGSAAAAIRFAPSHQTAAGSPGEPAGSG